MTAPSIIALDISKTCTGVAQGRVGERPLSLSLRGKDLEVTVAVSQLGRWLIERINFQRPDWVFFEAPLDAGAFRPEIDWEAKEWRSMRDPHTTLVLAKMVGVVEFITHMKSISTRAANIHKVRSAFIGPAGLRGQKQSVELSKCREVLGWYSEQSRRVGRACRLALRLYAGEAE